KEIPFNKIDDDGNGYIDDYYGWNFLGGADGRNISGETLESVRFYRENIKAFENISAKEVAKEDKEKYNLWLGAKKKVLSKIKFYNDRIENYTEWLKVIHESEDIIKEASGNDSIDINMVKEFAPNNKKEYTAKSEIIYADSVGATNDYLEGSIDYFSKKLEKSYNLDYNPRPDIVKDNPDDITDTIYGNSNIMASDYAHGTGVSGVVAAIRNNGIGTNGVADSVRLMVLRTSPGGDERDKDVALAIMYAVRNGAKVINCSFGKYYSKHPEFVSNAIDFAVANDVLIVHAAGNSSENNDKIAHFPTHNISQQDNWIDVGASGKEIGLGLAAEFSNYGPKSVDVYAPGIDIYTTSKNNNYRAVNGTSESSPIVAGLAAMLRSYYPDLSAKQVRDIILESAIAHKKVVVKYTDGKGDIKKTKFKKLSVTGAVVNAYEAVKMAENISTLDK
ncbi:MAG: peptidase S8, partial [Bacteroidetes bacterium]